MTVREIMELPHYWSVVVVVHSGLDWSEDIGGPWTVIAMVSIDQDDLEDLDREFAFARRNMGRDDDFVFKHLGAKPRVHREFYSAIVRVRSFQARVYRFDRSRWQQTFVKSAAGDPCICDGIITLAKGCPTCLVANQLLHIDLPRKPEGRIVDAFRTAIRKELRASKMVSFADVRPRPDDRRDGAIIQAADMIAGEVREIGGLGGPYLPLLGTRIVCI